MIPSVHTSALAPELFLALPHRSATAPRSRPRFPSAAGRAVRSAVDVARARSLAATRGLGGVVGVVSGATVGRAAGVAGTGRGDAVAAPGECGAAAVCCA